MPRPDINRVPVFYHKYINQVEGDDLNEILSKQAITFTAFLHPGSVATHNGCGACFCLPGALYCQGGTTTVTWL